MQEMNSRKTNSTWAVERRDGDLGKKVNLTLSLSNTFHCEYVYLKYNLEHNKFFDNQVWLFRVICKKNLPFWVNFYHM